MENQDIHYLKVMKIHIILLEHLLVVLMLIQLIIIFIDLK